MTEILEAQDGRTLALALVPAIVQSGDRFAAAQEANEGLSTWKPIRSSGAPPRLVRPNLGPLIFAPYADDLAPGGRPAGRRLLETLRNGRGYARPGVRPAAGRRDRRDRPQPADARPCIEPARSERVTWRQADAQTLPFPDGMFDAVVCQFGVMFFPDKPRAFAEAVASSSRGALPASVSGTASRRTSLRRLW